MKIGVMGLGKVGLPIALSLAVHGKHEVTGYDPSPAPLEILKGRRWPHREADIEELIAADHGITLVTAPGYLVERSDLVIIAVSTPHPPGFGGEQPVADAPRDFEYSFLLDAVASVCWAAGQQKKHITISVLSTVLPGTMRRLVFPLGNKYTTIIYSPVFISLGTTIPDFEYPPFVLCGTDNPQDADVLKVLYQELPAGYGTYFAVMSPESAEIAKMAYNAYGALRITFANMLAELCDKTGGNVDDVTPLLSFSPLSVTAGMPDGGPCRPRDLIALDWLVNEKGLWYDLFFSVREAREAHARWLGMLLWEQSRAKNLPIVILGKAYKPETDLTDGSPSLLVAAMLKDYPVTFWEPGMPVPEDPAVFLVAVRYEVLHTWQFPAGSVVIDPWGIVTDRGGITVMRLGRN